MRQQDWSCLTAHSVPPGLPPLLATRAASASNPPLAIGISLASVWVHSLPLVAAAALQSRTLSPFSPCPSAAEKSKAMPKTTREGDIVRIMVGCGRWWLFVARSH